jgi:hypothetical protein
MFTLSDACADLAWRLAQPLAPADRERFTQELRERLRAEPEIGEGIVHRVGRDLQRKYFAGNTTIADAIEAEAGARPHCYNRVHAGGYGRRAASRKGKAGPR